MRNLYEILGVSKDATTQQITAAYRRLAPQMHADKGGQDEKMMWLNEAYTTLKDDDKRRQFDEKWALVDEEEKGPSPIAGYLTTTAKPFSQVFRERHASLVSTYEEKPLVRGSAIENFEPLTSELYPKDEKDHKAAADAYYSDVYTFIAARTKTSSSNRTPFPQEPLNVKIAVAVFLDFLKGNYVGDTLLQLQHYLTTEIERLKKLSPNQMSILFYESVLLVCSAQEITPQNAIILFLATQNITQFAKASAHQAIPVLVNLFQSKYYRHFLASVLQAYWQLSPFRLTKLSRRGFDGSELLNQLLAQVKDKLATVNTDDRKNLLQQARRLRLLQQFEDSLNQKTALAQSGSDYREIGFHIIDWIMPLRFTASRQVVVNAYLQAGMYFQLASLHGSKASERMADERLALGIYYTTFEIARELSPDSALYANAHLLKYMAAFQFQDEALAQIIKAIQHHTFTTADVFPFVDGLQSNAAFLDGEAQSLFLIRQFLHALVAMLEANQHQPLLHSMGHTQVTVLYHAYEACLKNWYEDVYSADVENDFRQRLMQAMLTEKQWTSLDVRRHVDNPWIMIARDEKGWMQPTRSLPIPAHPWVEKFSGIEGLEVDYSEGEMTFYFKEFDEKTDPPYEKAITVFDFKQLLEREIGAALFSLDPPDPDKPYHPFNFMRFAPSSLHETDLLHTMFLTDYLLKFFTVNQEVRGRPPYDVRPLDPMLQHLPAYLRRIITDFHENQRGPSLHRFWIEAEDMPIVIDAEDAHREKLALGQLKMVVKKHLMVRDEKGHLVDQKENQEGWNLYVLTPDQKAALDQLHNQPQKMILSPAILFVKEEKHIYFFEQNHVSAQLPVINNLDFRRIFEQELHETGKIKHTTRNASLLFRVTRNLCARIGKPNRFSAEFIFAQEFTDHYDEFAQYFPEFGRLRELCRMITMIRFMKNCRKDNIDIQEKLHKTLVDEKHWQARAQEVQYEISVKNTQYDARYDQKKQSIYTDVLAHIRQLRSKCAKEVLVKAHKKQLSEAWEKMQPMRFNADSPAVTKICDEQYAEIERSASAQYGLSAWWSQCYEIRARIDSQKPEIAAALTRETREGYRESLKRQLKGSCHSKIESFLDGDVDSLAEALAEDEFSEVVSQLQTSFPEETTAVIRSALNGDTYQTNSMVTRIAERGALPVLKEKEETLKYIAGSITREKNGIRRQISQREKLERQFAQVGLGARAQDIDLQQTCLWVPANIKHEVSDHQIHLVYGGVCIAPQIRILEEKDPAAVPIKANAFAQTPVEAGYVAAARHLSLNDQPIPEDQKLDFMFHLRFMHAFNDAYARKNAEAAARAQAQAAASATAAAQSQAEMSAASKASTTSSSASSASFWSSSSTSSQTETSSRFAAANDMKNDTDIPPAAGAGGHRPPSPPSDGSDDEDDKAELQTCAAAQPAESESLSAQRGRSSSIHSPRFWREHTLGEIADEDSIVLYRSVSKNELEQIIQTKQFMQSPNSLEGKFFAESYEHAKKWGDIMNGIDNHVVIKIKISLSIANNMMRWDRLDSIGPARYATLDQLRNVKIYLPKSTSSFVFNA